jgi:hypothetical protein
MSNITGKKFGGRTKGTPNKITTTKRELVAKFIDDNFDDFIISYKGLEPIQKCKVFPDMLKFVLPYLQSIEVKDTTEDKTLVIVSGNASKGDKV